LGETPLQAAAREVREEAGVDVELIARLGDVHYIYMRDGRRIAKRVTYYAFRYVAGDPEDHDHEVEEARWLPAAEAATALTYAGDREMVTRASTL